MKVLILHNVTTLADLAYDGDEQAAADIARDHGNAKALAIFRRFGQEEPQRNDRLAVVGQLTFPEITGTDEDAIYAALNAAFAAGNAPAGPHVAEYRSWQVRSLSTGDVVVTQGRAFVVASFGWTEIDQRWSQFKIIGEFPREAAGHGELAT